MNVVGMLSAVRTILHATVPSESLDAIVHGSSAVSSLSSIVARFASTCVGILHIPSAECLSVSDLVQ